MSPLEFVAVIEATCVVKGLVLPMPFFAAAFRLEPEMRTAPLEIAPLLAVSVTVPVAAAVTGAEI
jgi:hypothetical protein